MTVRCGRPVQRVRGGHAWLIAIALPPLVAGCARSSGILLAGPDTYTVSEHYAIVRGG